MLHILRKYELNCDGQSTKRSKALLRIGNGFLSFSFQEMKGKFISVLNIHGIDK